MTDRTAAERQRRYRRRLREGLVVLRVEVSEELLDKLAEQSAIDPDQAPGSADEIAKEVEQLLSRLVAE